MWDGKWGNVKPNNGKWVNVVIVVHEYFNAIIIYYSILLWKINIYILFILNNKRFVSVVFFKVFNILWSCKLAWVRSHLMKSETQI